MICDWTVQNRLFYHNITLYFKAHTHNYLKLSTQLVKVKYTPFQGQIICGKSHLVDTTYYDDHENGQHLNGVNIFIIVY